MKPNILYARVPFYAHALALMGVLNNFYGLKPCHSKILLAT